jgi:hypothetical protein
MPEKQYLIFLDVDARKRHYHKSKGGKITQLMVQLEIRLEGQWREVIRYDCAHETIHKDAYNLAGKRRKWGIFLTYEEALSFADKDINEHWELYRDKFLRGEFP